MLWQEGRSGSKIGGTEALAVEVVSGEWIRNEGFR